jgi:subtilase family serine protease
MSYTQRNESLNNEIKGYISVKYDMLTFLSTLTDCLGTNDMKKLQVTSKQHRAHLCQRQN